jgi:hypothetical protein
MNSGLTRLHPRAGFGADRLTRRPEDDGATIVTAASCDVRQALQTVPDAGEVAELLEENQAFLESCPRQLKIALVQSNVAESVEDERHSHHVFGFTLQCQGLLADFRRSCPLATLE